MDVTRKGHKMTRLLELLPSRILRSEKGATSIEYALIASLIFLAIVVAVTGLGAKITGMYQTIVNRLP
jgi:pilus assembly protein Flp/PilA